MKAALALTLVLAQVWHWVDERGDDHYTDDRSTIPEKHRARATTTVGKELSVIDTGQRAPPRPSEPSAPRPAPSAPLTPAPAQPPGPPPSSARAAPASISIVLFESSSNTASNVLSGAGVIDKLVANNPGLKLERLEFATAVDRAEKLKVTQVPTVLFLDETGAERGRAVGLNTLKQLQKQLDQARGAAR